MLLNNFQRCHFHFTARCVLSTLSFCKGNHTIYLAVVVIIRCRRPRMARMWLDRWTSPSPPNKVYRKPFEKRGEFSLAVVRVSNHNTLPLKALEREAKARLLSAIFPFPGCTQLLQIIYEATLFIRPLSSNLSGVVSFENIPAPGHQNSRKPPFGTRNSLWMKKQKRRVLGIRGNI